MIVESNIIREGTDTLKINLKWRLLNKDNQIKIIDLNIEGISLVTVSYTHLTLPTTPYV